MTIQNTHGGKAASPCPASGAPDAFSDPALSRLSPALAGLLTLKAVMGGLCARRLPQALRLAALPPPKGQSWTKPDLAAAEHTLRNLGLTEASGRCRGPLEHRLAKRGVALHPAVLKALGPEKGSGTWADKLDLRLRLAVYGHDVAALPRIRADFAALCAEWEAVQRGPFIRTLRGGGFADLPPDEDWARALPAPLARVVLNDCLPGLLDRNEIAPILPPLLHDPPALFADLRTAPFADLLLLVLCGAFDEAERLALPPDTGPDTGPVSGIKNPSEGFQIRGLCAFFQGRLPEALAEWREARRRADAPKGRLGLERAPALAMGLALLAGDNPQTGEAQKLLECSDAPARLGEQGFAALQALLCLVRGQEERAIGFLRAVRSDAGDPFSRLVIRLARRLCGLCGPQDAVPAGRALKLLPVLNRLTAQVAGTRQDREEIGEEAGEDVPSPLIDLTRLLTRRATWELRLDNLARILEPAPVRQKRLIWLLHPESGLLEPLEQSGTAKGWSSGRSASLRRLCEQAAELSWLSEQDRRILGTARWKHVWNGISCALDPVPALCAAVGHPLLFRAADRAPVTLARTDTAVLIRERGDGFLLTLSRRPPGEPLAEPDPKNAETQPDLLAEGENAYRLYVHPPCCAELDAALGPQGLSVPRSAGTRLLELVRRHNPAVPLRLDVDTDTVDADPRPVLQLRPCGEGLAVAAVVRPLGADGPVCATGAGDPEPLFEIQGAIRRVRRDFAAEREALQAVLDACPGLAAAGKAPWIFKRLETALDLLLELRDCPAPLRLEWPEGRSLRPSPPLLADALSLSPGDGDGLRLRGEVRPDGDRALDLAAVLRSLPRASGNYVPLEDGEFLTLTERFRDLLERLAVLTEEEKDGSLKLHPLAAPALAGTLEENGYSGPVPGRELLRTIREAQARTPPLPEGLQASLRGYQKEGFVWLSRLAAWAGGACLADDMGLGKTVQTIALLLAEARHGPSLVVAPLSVCHNWESELRRFAPGLRVFRPKPGSGEKHPRLEAGDVLVVSYGLLRAQSALTGREWNVAVLDEAQALKNPTTQRARAGRGLRARFRLALTGTPVENRLEELWSLFEVILPGLLGSLPSFRRRFSGPGADRRDPAPGALKDLTRPFILRRTKNAVLAELPSRTEQTLEVELPPDERAFYEALRREAVRSLSGGEAAGPQRFQILAWLTRLRRACCHPRLIDPGSSLPGAKLAALLELVEDLRAGGHRALIFSQFTGNLALAREALEKAGVSWKYLDGSTPEKDRREAVAAFQAGEGDVFLISLRAGGQGINLTAADYVIHLDPWWNPAVEDQASDRAHRMGQQRPVTIYRLVAKDSVEENILKLHAAKRQLAADFLEGTDSALSEAELLALMGM